MIKNIPVEISIRDNKTGRYLRVPVLPEVITYAPGDAIKDAAMIINLGNVEFHNGVELDNMAWNSFFPARYDSAYCSTSNLLKPQAYCERFEKWKNEGTSLQVICPAAGINKRMVVMSFTWAYRGFEGDIYYQIEFAERRTIRPKKLKTSTVINKKKQPQDRPKQPAKPKPKTYTVKRGDNLTKIAKQYKLRNWQALYNANRSVIGSNPNLIFPGQVLRIP